MKKNFLISIILIALAVIIASSAFAGPKVSVAKKGTYVYWFTYKDAKGIEQTTLPQRFKGKSAELDTQALGSKFSAAKLYVINKSNGNLAIADYTAPKDPKKPEPIDLEKSDFEFVRNVDLRIVSEDGAPIESAIVGITDGEGTAMQTIVTPADEGVARFANVASGELTVKVQAKGVKKTINSDIELPENRDTAGFAKDIKVSGDVDTLPVVMKKEAANAGKHSESKSSSGSLAFQMIAGFIFLIVLIAVIAVIVITVGKSKGITAQQALQRMGVEIPQDGSAVSPGIPAAPAIDPNTCQFCGQRKDANGNCACSIAAGSSPFGQTAGAASEGPRLIGVSGTYSGHIFNISDGSAVIGRDATNPVPLPNDTTSSRRHATIAASNGGYIIRDEGSSNGTFVNGARITEQKLTPGDEVQIGGTRFRFEV